ncbi:MAG: AbrB/MazE/SpoVT family DNA-binding domain-containing protein [Firmicutes bacterium]|nr:AbrB/MazE/SpoVT family DNA-binding domain-containing protein [Bacillota bacterium]
MPKKIGKVTSKGQLTIPKEIREFLNVKEGDGVLFVAEEAKVYIERIPAKVTSEQVFGTLKRTRPLEWAAETLSGETVDVEKARIAYRSKLADEDLQGMKAASDPPGPRGNLRSRRVEGKE